MTDPKPAAAETNALTTADIIELGMDSEEAMLFAWGIHTPEAFIAAAGYYGLDQHDAARVEHARYLRLNRP